MKKWLTFVTGLGYQVSVKVEVKLWERGRVWRIDEQAYQRMLALQPVESTICIDKHPVVFDADYLEDPSGRRTRLFERQVMDNDEP